MARWLDALRPGRALQGRLDDPERTLRDVEIEEGAIRYKETSRPPNNDPQATFSINGAARQEASQETSPANGNGSANQGASASQDSSTSQRSWGYRVCLRLLCWLLYNVAFALLPILLTKVSAAGAGESMPLDLLLEDGDLALIAVAMAGGAAGEIVNHQASKGTISHIVLVWGNITICMMGAWVYSQISMGHWVADFVTRASVGLFGSALVSGICSIVRSEDK